MSAANPRLTQSSTAGRATLGFDCSTDGCSAAVIDDTGAVLAQAALASPVAQAEALMPLIGSVLATAGLRWTDIGLIGVTVGPGSFTGIRIGLAAARGFALARGLPLVGICTATVFAHAVSAEERRDRMVLVAIESKRTDFFVQLFGSDLSVASALLAATPHDALTLTAHPMLLIGNGAERLMHSLDASAGTKLRRAVAGGPPDPVLVARLAATCHADGSGLAALPLYVRPPDVTLSPPQSGPTTSSRPTEQSPRR